MNGTRKAHYMGETEPTVSFQEMIEKGNVPVSRHGTEITFRTVHGISANTSYTRVDFGDSAANIQLVDSKAFTDSLPCRINRSGEAEVLVEQAAREQVTTAAALREAECLYPEAFSIVTNGSKTLNKPKRRSKL